MDIYDHQDASTTSYGDNVVTPLACDLVRDKHMVRQEVFMNLKNSRPASIHVVWCESTKHSVLSM